MISGNRSFVRSLGIAVGLVIADYLLVLTSCLVAGRVLGEVALGAMNLLMPVFSGVTFFIWLLASSTSSAYSVLVRRGEERSAAKLAGEGLLFSLLLGALLVLVLWGLEAPYLAFMSPDASLTDYSGEYWRWYPLCVLLQSIECMLLYLFFVRGGERACIYSFCVQVAVNAWASYWLCARIGMAGIALGMIIAYSVGLAGLVLWAFLHRADVQFRFNLKFAGFWSALRFSMPEALIWLVHALLFFIIIKYVLYFWDSESLSVCAVVFCIIRLTLFFGGIGVALRALGPSCREVDLAPLGIVRAVRFCAALAFGVMALLAVLLFIAPEPLIGLFGIESADLVEGSRFAARITVVGLLIALLAALIPLVIQVRRTTMPTAPLNYLQRYVLSRIEDGVETQMFNLAKLFRLRKGIDLQRLANALVTSGRSHAALRTTLCRAADGEFVQSKMLKEEDVCCPIEKISEEDLLRDKSSLVRNFTIRGGRLFEAKIFDCGETAYLLSNFHHLICDGYSFPLILADAHRVFDGEVLEPDAYYDVLARREERARLPLAVTGRQFMRETLKARSYVTLPKEDFQGVAGYGVFEQPIALSATFETFLAAHRATRHHVFLSAAVVALSRMTGANDLLIDWVFHGRVSKDELKTVGAFMVDLPLIVENLNDQTKAEIIANIKRSTFNGIKGVNIFRDVADCNPTGQDRLTFIYQDEWGELMSSGPVRKDGPYAWMIEETIPLVSSRAATENPFNVEIMEHQDSTRLFIEYDPGRYAEATARRYAELFIQSLNWLIDS